jgi:hypothetical protein
MNIQIFSDLHVDVSRPPPITIGADVDVVVVAGDTVEGAGNAFVALRHIVPERTPIVMVMGNHEYYHACIPDELALARELAPSLNVHLLENASVVLKAEGSGTPVLFAGCSLWTDYQVFGANNAAPAMRAALKGLNDHRLITWQKRPWKRFRPQEAALMHSASKAFLIKTLATPFPGPTVVVCHHGHWRSAIPNIRPIFLRRRLSRISLLSRNISRMFLSMAMFIRLPTIASAIPVSCAILVAIPAKIPISIRRWWWRSDRD